MKSLSQTELNRQPATGKIYCQQQYAWAVHTVGLVVNFDSPVLGCRSKHLGGAVNVVFGPDPAVEKHTRGDVLRVPSVLLHGQRGAPKIPKLIRTGHK